MTSKRDAIVSNNQKEEIMMSNINRRDFLKISAGRRRRSALGGGAGATRRAKRRRSTCNLKPEKGAKLRVLRWKRFVQGDEDMWAANTKKFTEKTGIEVRVDAEGWEDVRPKAAVAANVGSGPDIIISTIEDAHQYPDKLVDVCDVANYLGAKYGGWYDAAKDYGMHDKKWVAIPMGAAGNAIVYRESQVKAAGFDTFPKDIDGFLKLCQALKAKGTPAGFALGNATGDASWCHWLVWAHGGKMVDENNNVVINSPETIAALEYAKELYATFIPGTLSWLDPNNNKAFLDGQMCLTANGISIYYAAKNSKDPKLKEMANDIQHANFPVGPVGKSRELNLVFPMMIFKYSKYPNAAKEYLRFMMEKEQYEPWQEASNGYVWQPLTAYEKSRSGPPIRRTRLTAMHEEHDAGRLCRHDGLCVGGAHGRLHHPEHGGGGGLGREDAEGSGRARAEARGALLQGLIARARLCTPSRFRRDAPRFEPRLNVPACAQACIAMATSNQPRSRRLLENRNFLGFMFMLPAAVLLLLFLTYPLGLGMWLGFTDAKVGRRGHWIGLDNFVYLCGDSVTRLSLFNTLFYTVVASIIKFALGPVAGDAAEPAHAVQVLHPRRGAAAVHRADGAVGDRLLVDLRLAVLGHQLGADASSG